jgi:hypothetical protein
MPFSREPVVTPGQIDGRREGRGVRALDKVVNMCGQVDVAFEVETYALAA